ncbi:iron-containing alcohol dehydrogenase [Alteribacillus bidgolensis]|uniref:Alcohol dehydrogenase, class IV n=1 Tax=Alteribacillus bidgolensis TaxID=930129 RepID=A0A1G8S0D9_9BACI|nr:iron-containing alcohol dehydrogenase [Alteribacillus bidgolensis]SDJ22255.1 Alcohol dehydrogenase, class IV [Alteribacillus bidgolensis]
MDKVYKLLMPNAVLYGSGALNEVGEQAKKLGNKALIISDAIMQKIGNVDTCETYLQQSGVPYEKYLGVDTEPTNIHVAEALEKCMNEECDIIIAIGGGSCIDTAKAVAVLRTNEGTITDYFGTQKQFKRKPIPLIAIPTTAGTGSEVTKVTVITDTQTDVKMMFSRPELLPQVAIVDPKLTISCPKGVTAAAGVDALCHAIEAFISKKAQPVTDTLALSAIENIMTYIRRAYNDGHDMEAREKMAYGAMLAGIAFSNASVTLVHGISRPIGALFHVQHGISNAMLLPAVLEFTKEAAEERLAFIGRVILPEAKEMSNEELANIVIYEVKKLCLDLNIPNMKAYGIDEEPFKASLSKMAHDALASGSPNNHPKVPVLEEVMKLYETCYSYDFSMDVNISRQ